MRSLSSSLSSSSAAAHLAPTQVLGAEETGTAEQLAHFILAQLSSQRGRESGSGSASLLLAPPTPTSDGNGSTGAGSASSTSLTLTGSVSTDNLSVFTSVDSPTHASNPPAQGQGESQTPQTPVSPTPSHRPQSQNRARARSLRKPTKLLFLVGDKTRDVLPSLLSADAHVELDSVQVYTAKPSPNFPNALKTVVLAQPKGALCFVCCLLFSYVLVLNLCLDCLVIVKSVKDWWIAIFAPSGADYALPYLREHFTLLPSSSSSSSSSAAKDKEKDKKRFKKNKGPPVARLAAIGPTTAAHLREVLKLDVAAEARKPNPEALVEAIRSAGK